jgi:hypothetical protein
VQANARYKEDGLTFKLGKWVGGLTTNGLVAHLAWEHGTHGEAFPGTAVYSDLIIVDGAGSGSKGESEILGQGRMAGGNFVSWATGKRGMEGLEMMKM